MPTQLAKTIKTASQKQQVFAEIENLTSDLSTTTPPTHHEIQKKYPILSGILREQGDKSDKNVTQETLSALRKELQGLRELTVAVNPQVKETDLENIADDLHPNALVDVIPSSAITAGLTCSYQGIYRDFTLDKIIKGKIASLCHPDPALAGEGSLIA